MTIGVLKEGDSENRVVLLPEHVASLVKKEFQVLVEKECRADSICHPMKVIRKLEPPLKAGPRF